MQKFFYRFFFISTVAGDWISLSFSIAPCSPRSTRAKLSSLEQIFFLVLVDFWMLFDLKFEKEIPA